MLVSSIKPFEYKRSSKSFGKNAAVRPIEGSVCDTVSFMGQCSNYFINAVKACKDAKNIEVLLKYMNDKEKTQALLTEDSDVYDRKYIPLDYVLMSRNKQNINKKVKILLELAPDDETREEMLGKDILSYISDYEKDEVTAEKVKVLLNAVSNNEKKQRLLSYTDEDGFNALKSAIGKPKTIKVLFDNADCDTILEMVLRLAEYTKKLEDVYFKC